MKNIAFYALVGLLFTTATVNADRAAYIPLNIPEPHTTNAPKTEEELDAAIRQTIKEINEKLTRIDGKIQEIKVLMNRLDGALENRKQDVLCEALAASSSDIQKVTKIIGSLTDANERKKVTDRLTLLKAVNHEQNTVIKEKGIVCLSQ